MSERLTILEKLADKQDLIVVAPVDALMQRTLPRRALNEFTILLGVGEELDRAVLTTALIDTGTNILIWSKIAGFSVRGGIVDIFPSLSQNPIRLEFFGDEIRPFANLIQNSTLISGAGDGISAADVRDRSDRFDLCCCQRTDRTACSEAGASFNALKMLMDHIDQKIFFPGIEWYAPYFHGKLETCLISFSGNPGVFG